MKQTNIYSVSGLIGAGKDTVAQYMIDRYGYTRISFSAALKDAVAVIFGFDRNMLEGITPAARAEREVVDPWWSKKLGYEVSPRSILQDFGSRIMRDTFHQNIWVLALERRIEMATAGRDAQGLVASDARFFNEMSMVQGLGGINIRVTRNEPVWVDNFRRNVDQRLRDRVQIGLADCDLSNFGVADTVRKIGVSVMAESNLNVHQSEWEHVLWQNYLVVQNETSLADLYRCLDLILN